MELLRFFAPLFFLRAPGSWLCGCSENVKLICDNNKAFIRAKLRDNEIAIASHNSFESLFLALILNSLSYVIGKMCTLRFPG